MWRLLFRSVSWRPIVPTTNPTSTAIFKILIAIKGRNPVVLSPHPQAVKCTAETARIMYEAARKAGAPEGCIGCVSNVTLQGTTELMQNPKSRMILATGGPGLVKAAYSSGKPAFGVGPGNVPAFIERTADVSKAVRDVVAGKTFDYGLLCSSEQALVCDLPLEEEVLQELEKNRAYLLDGEEQGAARKSRSTASRWTQHSHRWKVAAGHRRNGWFCDSRRRGVPGGEASRCRPRTSIVDGKAVSYPGLLR